MCRLQAPWPWLLPLSPPYVSVPLIRHSNPSRYKHGLAEQLVTEEALFFLTPPRCTYCCTARLATAPRESPRSRREDQSRDCGQWAIRRGETPTRITRAASHTRTRRLTGRLRHKNIGLIPASKFSSLLPVEDLRKHTHIRYHTLHRQHPVVCSIFAGQNLKPPLT